MKDYCVPFIIYHVELYAWWLVVFLQHTSVYQQRCNLLT